MTIIWFILQWIIITALLFLERTMGVPVLGLAWALWWSVNFRSPWQYFWLIWLWGIISVVYLMPFSLVAVAIGAGYVWVKYGQTIVFSQLVRVISLVILNGLLLLLLKQQLSIVPVMYVVVAPLLLISAMKVTKFRIGMSQK